MEDMELRVAMLAAAEQQLVGSANLDIATRAVCEAVGVTQPVLYRLFGDKQGLLDALADAGLEWYARRKGGLEKTADPVLDLRAGWDDHMAFAGEHPALYQLMFSPRPWSRSTARIRVRGLLQETLERCAAAGALAVDPRSAAAMILSANVGLALNRVAEPSSFSDADLSHRLRDSVFAAVLVQSSVSGSAGTGILASVVRLRAQLARPETEVLEPAELALLDRWLERLVEALMQEPPP